MHIYGVSNRYECCSVRKRPFIADVAPGFREIGAVAVEHGGDVTPPLAVSFCKVCGLGIEKYYNLAKLRKLDHFESVF